LTNTVELSTAAGSDAESAHWLDLEATDTDEGLTLKLHYNGEVVYENSCGKTLSDKLAFDHGNMILDAFLKLRDEVINHDMIFGLMPEYFTISDLQQPYEAITGIHISPQGFRKKVIGKLTETDSANSILSEHRMRTTADPAASISSCRELRFHLLFSLHG
jgi:hypothetical protein